MKKKYKFICFTLLIIYIIFYSIIGAEKVENSAYCATQKNFLSADTSVTGFSTGFSDFIEPAITYRSSKTVVDYNAKKITVVFDVTDKYFSSSNLTNANQLTILVDGEVPNWGVASANGNVPTRAFTSIEDIENTYNITQSGAISQQTKIIGKRYTLEITGFEQGKGVDYSGVVTIVVPANIITDTVYNYNGDATDITRTNIATTITVGSDYEESQVLKLNGKYNTNIAYNSEDFSTSSHSSTTTTWYDISGNGNNGTINNGTWGENYLELNGTSTWVNLGHIQSNYQTIQATFSLDKISDSVEYIIGNWNNSGRRNICFKLN